MRVFKETGERTKCVPQDQGADLVIELMGRRIGELRARAGKTQASVAEAISMHLPNYQRIEHGLQNCTVRTLHKIATAIGVGVGDFFTLPQSDRGRRGRPKTTPTSRTRPQ